jgi:hypothetical protein
MNSFFCYQFTVFETSSQWEARTCKGGGIEIKKHLIESKGLQHLEAFLHFAKEILYMNRMNIWKICKQAATLTQSYRSIHTCLKTWTISCPCPYNEGTIRTAVKVSANTLQKHRVFAAFPCTDSSPFVFAKAFVHIEVLLAAFIIDPWSADSGQTPWRQVLELSNALFIRFNHGHHQEGL